ncbi:MAG TPA: YciI family protein [Myxococcaceae bacterium]|nr:YciI family protein [Myxococcaceae bacterium]
MSEFLYLYRLPADSPELPGSAQNLQLRLQKWTEWFKELEARGTLKVLGHPLQPSGAVVADGGKTVLDGPYAESKDIVLGYSLVQAKDLAEARAIAGGCPVLTYGGMVEVRPILQM